MVSVNSFSGKRVLITGAGQGIGHEILKRFYNDGATVFVIDKNQVLLDAITAEMPNVTTLCVDLINWEAAQEAVKKCTPLDHLVNNAGVFQAQSLLETTSQVFDWTYGVNVRAIVAVSQTFVNENRKTGHPGTIVNMSSLGDRKVFYGGGIYGSSKAALTNLTASMGFEFAEFNIRTNCVCPSFVATEMISSIPQEFLLPANELINRRPMKEPNETSDIADAVIFLSSPASRRINGTSILVDGGLAAT